MTPFEESIDDSISKLLEAVVTICEQEARQAISEPLCFSNDSGEVLLYFRHDTEEAVVFVGNPPASDRFALFLRPGATATEIVELARRVVDTLDPFSGPSFAEVEEMLDDLDAEPAA